MNEIAPTSYRAPSPQAPATVITSDEQAIAVAKAIAPRLRDGAAERDRDRRLPYEEVNLFSQSGLWGITVPRAYGGAGVSQATLAEVFKIIAAAASSIAQLPQNHIEIVDLIRQTGSEEQKRDLFGLVLKGYRLGNAFSEYKGKNVEDFLTRIRRTGDDYTVDGEKFYSTGALFAHLVPIIALDEAGLPLAAIVDRDSAGLDIIDDWSAFGQRTTASGTVKIQSVRVPAARVLPAYIAYEAPSPAGPQSQLAHAAIDLGIAENAVDTTISFVRDHARPWIDSGQEKASDDPYTIAQIGDLKVRLHAAWALLRQSAASVDAAITDPTPQAIAKAKIDIAEAKILSTEIALLATNKLFELAGTRATLARFGLDRLWRDARTHTLHDPVRWKFHAIGQYYLNGKDPPLHSWI